nr:hypothetical protein [Pseudobutyrivibrio sp.]
DGQGDISGIISQISYLKDLGVDSILLNSECNNQITTELNNSQGNFEDMYDKLISKAKRSGIKVFANEELGEAIGVDVSTSTDHMDTATKQFLSLNLFYPQNFIFALDRIQQENDFPLIFMEDSNHDRSLDLFGNTSEFYEISAKLLCGLNLSLKGLPVIFQGQEMGLVGSVNEDIDWEKTNNNSILEFYKTMIEFRKNSKALIEGTYRRVASPRNVYIFTREAVEERLYIYCNLTSRKIPVEFYGDRVVLNNYSETDREPMILKPYEFCIVKSDI